MKTTNQNLRTLTGLAILTSLVAGCLVAGCLADGTASNENDTSNPNALGGANGPNASGVHLMLRSDAPTPFAKTTASAAHLTYYGGPVVSNIKVYTIFWGGTTKVNYASQINSFYTGVTNSPYFDWLSEYNTPTQSIGRGTFAGSYSYTNGATGTVDDSAIQSAVLSLIQSGALPAPDANTYYPIHFAPGITITQGGQGSCSVFCAYHGTISNSTGKGTAQYVYYGVIPDQGGACAGGCGGDPSQFNNTTSVSSHEMIETTTDAAVGLATGNSAPLAWYDQTNGEIGDICNAQQGSIVGGDGATYTIQLEWSNSDNACIASKSGGGTSSSSSSSTSSTSTSSTSSSTSSTSSTSSSSSGGGTCSHPICSQGSHLTSGCDPCATKICGQDPYCCNTLWDNVCVGEVGSICGESCSGGSSSSSSTSTSSTSSSSSSSSGGGTCAHSDCVTGSKLKSGCNANVTKICAADPYCCNTKWDNVCVGEVKSIGNGVCSN